MADNYNYFADLTDEQLENIIQLLTNQRVAVEQAVYTQTAAYLTALRLSDDHDNLLLTTLRSAMVSFLRLFIIAINRQ